MSCSAWDPHKSHNVRLAGRKLRVLQVLLYMQVCLALLKTLYLFHLPSRTTCAADIGIEAVFLYSQLKIPFFR